MHANVWVNRSYVPACILFPLYRSISAMFRGNVGNTKRLEPKWQVNLPVRRCKQKVGVRSGDCDPYKARIIEKCDCTAATLVSM